MKGEGIVLAVVDTRERDISDWLSRELHGWRGYARAEWLDEHHAVLLVRPGGAVELQR